MSRPVAVFYHSFFFMGDPPEPAPTAIGIVGEQMQIMRAAGLEEGAQEIICGINGGEESEPFGSTLLPVKAVKIYHGLQSRSENLTLLNMQEWVKSHAGWAVLYWHAKGATHCNGKSPHAPGVVENWRNRMTYHCVHEWRRCVNDLNYFEATGCHWLTNQGHDGSQNYFAGTFFWVRSEFFATIPSMMTRARIQSSGIDSLESRYEAEVVIGNGPRLPTVRDYFPGHPFAFMQ